MKINLLQQGHLFGRLVLLPNLCGSISYPEAAAFAAASISDDIALGLKVEALRERQQGLI